ncbi:hypothetical protein HNQ66_004629 [Shinella fusca]|uniref:Uncharacterized protein n=1 Tax=Shinella fusca TaxID=544480 RepID=A0A7W8DWY2_9HYPH|nr:hypothetical protein [Shinella fusca]
MPKKLFRDIFRNAYLPYRDPETLRAFLREINSFTYDHSEKLGGCLRRTHLTALPEDFDRLCLGRVINLSVFSRASDARKIDAAEGRYSVLCPTLFSALDFEPATGHKFTDGALNGLDALAGRVGNRLIERPRLLGVAVQMRGDDIERHGSRAVAQIPVADQLLKPLQLHVPKWSYPLMRASLVAI